MMWYTHLTVRATSAVNVFLHEIHPFVAYSLCAHSCCCCCCRYFFFLLIFSRSSLGSWLKIARKQERKSAEKSFFARVHHIFRLVYEPLAHNSVKESKSRRLAMPCKTREKKRAFKHKKTHTMILAHSQSISQLRANWMLLWMDAMREEGVCAGEKDRDRERRGGGAHNSRKHFNENIILRNFQKEK